MFELLESRELFSAVAAVTVQLDHGTLHITGTPVSDTIFVTEHKRGTGQQFNVDQQIGNECLPLATVPESLVSRIVVNGQDGDDFLVLQTSGKVGGDVFGGKGDDEIHLEDDGAAVSTGHGGDDDDLLVIFSGKGTKAFGDDGSDRMISYERTNTTYLYGGRGSDHLQGTSATVMDPGDNLGILGLLL